MRLAVLALLFLFAPTLAAQPLSVVDTFEDGDFSSNPVWLGDAERFTVSALDGSQVLRLSGRAEADTAALSTPSGVSDGTWRFRIGWRNVNLSTSSGARVYLVSNRDDLTGAVEGYFLQFGTNNSPELRLYRQDGLPTSANRVEIGASGDVLLDGEQTLTVEVTRMGADWAVSLGGTQVLTASDDAYSRSVAFGWWIKHIASTADGFFLDDVQVNGSAGPPDTTAPKIATARYDDDANGFGLTFSEPVQRGDVTQTNFALSPGSIASVTPFPATGDADSVFVATGDLANGTYQLSISGIRDIAGNALADTTLTFVIERDTQPPSITSVVAEGFTLRVRFSERIDRPCDVAYRLEGVAPDAPPRSLGTGCDGAIAGDSVRLDVQNEVPPGVRYRLVAPGLTDLAGNVQPNASIEFSRAATPQLGDVVVNEFMASPDAGGVEYVELFNRSDQDFNLSTFSLADATGSPRPIASSATFAAGSYVVVASDTTILQSRFPDGFGGSRVLQSTVPSLNNGGDTIVLSSSGTAVDSLAYTAAQVQQGVALERVDPAVPGVASNFALSTDPSGGTPGRINSQFAPDVTLPMLIELRVAVDTLRLQFSEFIPDACRAGYSLPDVDAGAPSVGIDACIAAGDSVRLALTPDLSRGVGYRLVITDLTDAAGNTQARIERDVRIGFLPVAGEIVVNEVLAAPATSDGSEFAELLNTTDRPLSLDGLSVFDSGNTLRALPSGLTLPPGGYLILAPDTSALRVQFPGGFDGALIVRQAPWPSLNNGGDRFGIARETTIIDTLQYTASQVESGVSLERVDPAVPGVPSNLRVSSDPSGATPGRRNTQYAPDLDRPTVIRAYYMTEESIAVRFSESVQPGGVLTINGQTLVATAQGDLVIAIAPPGAPAVGIAGWRDLRGNALAGATSAPLAQRPASGALVINEILFAPNTNEDDGPIQPEYLELVNTTDRPVTLFGVALTSSPLDDLADVDTTRLDVEVAVAPGAFALIYDADSAAPLDGRLRSAFPDLDTTALSIGISTVTPSGLANGGERIALFDLRSDTEIDAVPYQPSWTDANRRTTTGFSLERLAFDAPSDDALTWASSIAEAGGTPTRANSVTRDVDARMPQPGEVRITEVLFDPARVSSDGIADQTDFFEIYNASSDALRLNGLTLLDAPDERGPAVPMRLVYTPSTLAPGAYAAVYAVSGIYADAADPDRTLLDAFPDADGALIGQRRTLSLPNDGRLLHLTTFRNTTLDSVRYTPDWHNPAVRDGTGLSLEKIDPLAPSNDSSSWGTSASGDGATPAQRNSLTPAPGDDDLDQPGLTISPSPFSPDADGFEDVATIRYRLRAASNSIRVRIFDHRGREVRELRRVTLAGQSGTLSWDGYDDHGDALRIGLYVVHLEAVDTDGGVESHRAVVALVREL